MEKYIVYKGKGEHSVHELEKIIAQREEELHHIKSLPTSLPSDEEIGQEFKFSSDNWEVRQALEEGAKWMRDKIQGDNK